jgi:hypothetical protein
MKDRDRHHTAMNQSLIIKMFLYSHNIPSQKANNHCGIVIIHPYMYVCVLTADREIKNKEREAFRKEFDR